jgi:NADH dehydrogenase
LVRHNSPSEELAKQGLATSAESLIDAGALPAYGDMKDHDSLAAACQGVKTVVTTANSALRGGEDTVETVDRIGNQNLIDAAVAAGVQHFVFTSALIASKDSPSALLRAKALSEEHLCASSMNYTILAPNAFLESWAGMIVGGPLRAGQPVTLVGEAQRKHSFISTGDVAAFAVAAVDNPLAKNRRLAIGGPEAVSWRDVVATCEQALGRELPVRFVTPGEAIPGQGEGIAELMAAMETYDSVIDMAETAREFGVRLTPLSAIAERMFATQA